MKKRLISSVIALAMTTAMLPAAFVYAEAAVSSNIASESGVTNIGSEATKLISIDFGTDVSDVTTDNIELYVGDKKIEQYTFYAQTATGVQIDPKYFSDWSTNACYTSIYPTSETECSIKIKNVKAASGEAVQDTELNFTKGLILPLDYKENAVIENVALNKSVLLADGVTENALIRGNKEVVTDGKLYGNWDSMFSPTMTSCEQNQVFFTVDLGKQYDIAGITLFGAQHTASGRMLYSVECNNQPNTFRTAAKGHILWSGWDENKATNIIGDVNNEVATNFSYSANRQRYIHVARGMAGGKEIDVTELMAWAYVYGDEDTYKEYQSLGNKYTDEYIAEARAKYSTAEYSDYKASVVDNYYGDNFGSDRPDPAVLIWDKADGAVSYTLKISSKEDFSDDVITYTDIKDNRYDVFNLKTNSHYYWKAISDNGIESKVYDLYTKDGVRYIYAEKSKNIRDLGGWNGLNQGYAFRGSEINEAQEHLLGLDEDGIKIFRDDLGIKTELDLRKESETGGITSSILGNDVKYVNIEATNYHSIFTGTHIDNFKKELELFADIKNYPIYFHCWGGADRTGTLAFFIEGLCGVSETDLAVDFELTSFSHFGLRHRYDGSGFYYASLLNKIKEYSGDTLQEKFENAAMNTFGLSRIQIANIQSVFSGSSVVFANTTDGSDEGISGTSFPFKLANLGEHTVKSVKFDNTEVEFKLENNILTVAMPDEEGMGTITFDDDNTLNIYSVGGNTAFTSNVKDKTGITNVGDNATELISVDFQADVKPLTKDNIELYVGDKAVDDFEITPTENGFKLDPMYFSTLKAEKNTKNIYPASESECRIVINGVTAADGTSLGKYSVNFTGGLILPVPYKENSKIMNVSQGIAPILASGVVENKHNRGNKEVVTDGKLYGGWPDVMTATFETTQYNQAIFKLDLGAEYDIAGIALSGSANSSGYNCFYAVECNNDPDTSIMTEDNQLLRTTWIVKKTDFVGYDIDTKQMTDNEILSNFSVGENKSRYVHVGTAIPRTGLDVSELMVWAYVEKITVTPSLTSVGNNGIITNVGTNASEYVKLSLNNDSVSLGDSIDVKITAANGSEATAAAKKLANENAYRIEVKALAGLSAAQNTVQGFVSSGTVKAEIPDTVSTDGKYVSCDSASAEVGQIVPLEYKNGKIIVDTAYGKGVYMPNSDGKWTGLLTDGSIDTIEKAPNAVLSTANDETGKTETKYDHSKPALKLDLGAEYDIAGMAVTGIDSGHYTTRYQRFITSNASSLDSIDNVSEYLKTPGTSTVSKAQALTSFPVNTVNARYIYIGNTNNYQNIGISDIHVYAYVDADKANLYTANSANGGIKAGSYYTGDNKIIIGKYTSDGVLVKATASDGNGIAEADCESGYGYRIFMWDSLSGMKPLTDDIKYN